MARRRALVSVAATLATLVVATSAASKNVIGTARNDNLRGTNANDVLNGKAGNDTLSGLAGNDRLIGGRGKDRLHGDAGHDSYSCGSGRDEVFADYDETVASDCEIVHRAPPPQLAAPGHYAAPGNFLSFDVGADGRTVTTFFVRAIIPCTSSFLLSLPVTAATTVPIQEDKTFSIEYDSTGGLTPHLSATGAFDAAGNASGSVTIRATFGSSQCQGSLSWTAAKT